MDRGHRAVLGCRTAQADRCGAGARDPGPRGGGDVPVYQTIRRGDGSWAEHGTGLPGGDRVLVRRDSGPRAGDVVVLRHPPAGSDAATTPSWIIKRVAATQASPCHSRPYGRVPGCPPVGSSCWGTTEVPAPIRRRVGYYRSDDLLGTVVRRLSTANRAGERVAPEITRD